jgi:hypothetical protein
LPCPLRDRNRYGSEDALLPITRYHLNLIA